MGMTKKSWEDYLENNEEAKLSQEIDQAFDRIFDILQRPVDPMTKPGYENSCRHRLCDYPMHIYGIQGMWYCCGKCGKPMKKFIPYSERLNND